MKMEPTIATCSLKHDLMCEESMVDIRIVTESDLMCEELIIDVPLVMEPAQWPECCIYRVPKNLRQINEEAYSPKLISIGPFHHGKEEVRDMEKLKVRYLKEFCYRTGKCQKEIARVIEENEVKIRRCYEEIFDMSSEDFVKMVLLDSTFIIELFMRANDKKDYMSSKPLLNCYIQADLILLENQLPFFILEELHKKFSKGQNSGKSFFTLAIKYFISYIKNIPAENNEVKHFIDLIRYSRCARSELRFKERKCGLYSATKLHAAGVVFKVNNKEGSPDIKFKKSQPLYKCPCFTCLWLLNWLPCLRCFWCLEHMQPLLKFPSITIDDRAEGLLRNIMALEQCHYPFKAYTCNYMLLLDYLIDTREDVDLLVKENIIVNGLGSNKAVANMVNKLSLEIVENSSCYADLAQELNAHYNQCCNHNMASLRSIYFADVWRGTATIVGLIVFVFTFWNTIRPYVIK
ncbi:hypothetical protein SO802_009097 [Lithocarpus litseifolius]|uniref:Uncharacterized protein n=1 Tax=Lithocarpus litseifolius TaxID=425828 RepID=A0AAW2DEA9_9ROSI